MALVRKTLDELEPVSEERLREIAAIPDEEIDFSDIPELDEAWFAEAKLWTPPSKKQITLRLDEDVVAFFKESGKGYQTRMNAVLRAFVEAKKKRA